MTSLVKAGVFATMLPICLVGAYGGCIKFETKNHTYVYDPAVVAQKLNVNEEDYKKVTKIGSIAAIFITGTMLL